ncbi:MAG: penicillin acylase family protein [bacterium]
MKRIFVWSAAVAIVLLGALYFYVNGLLSSGVPVIEGTVRLPGLKENVRVLRDRYGIPHIFARDEEDAYYALGFVHAQDRLWEMETIRRAAEGRLSELFGNQQRKAPYAEWNTLLDHDRFCRVIGFWDMGKRYAGRVKEPARTLMKKYTEGVNAWTERNRGNLPPEFRIVSHVPEPWSAADIIALARYVAWGLSSNLDAELLRYEAVSRFGAERGWELLPRHKDSPGPWIIPPSEKKYDPRGKTIEKNPVPIPPELISPNLFSAILDMNRPPPPPGFGVLPAASNNWVVAGARSASGAPILCNDPHLPHMLPSIFYLAHLKTDDGVDVAGVTFPGAPFVVLGHNRRAAWAATTTLADVQDLFIEKTDAAHPGRYLYKGKWENFGIRKETIFVKTKKGKNAIVLNVRNSRHGPILNDMLPEHYSRTPPIALRWAGHDPSEEYFTFLKLSRARDINDVRKALLHAGTPIQNWLFADADGGIGFFPAGKVPVRKKGDGTFPVPGWTGEYDWAGFIPYDELPQLYNPSQGFIITANNQVVPEEDYPYVFSFRYMMYRAQRIQALIESKDKLTVDDMKKFQMDNHSLQGERLRDRYVEAYEKRGDRGSLLLRRAVEKLKEWNLKTDAGSAGAAVFFRAYYETITRTLADELSPEMLGNFTRSWTSDSVFDGRVETGEFSFFDDVRTAEKESSDDVLAAALGAAAEWLAGRFGNDVDKWEWGGYHRLESVHAFSGIPVLSFFFGQPGIPLQGSRNTVDAEDFAWADDTLLAYVGAAMRQVIDMAHPERAAVIIDSGQSGHLKSPHYRDHLRMWLKGEYVPMWMNEDDVRGNLEGELRLVPEKSGRAPL